MFFYRSAGSAQSCPRVLRPQLFASIWIFVQFVGCRPVAYTPAPARPVRLARSSRNCSIDVADARSV